MSWLALYVRRGETLAKESYYFPRHGNDLVTAMLRTWRRQWQRHDRLPVDLPALAEGEVFKGVGYFHEHLLRPLLLGDETCWRLCRRPPIWGTQRGWFRARPVSLAHWGSLLLTDRAFFYIWSQEPPGKKSYVFDFNLMCFSSRVLSHSLCRHVQVGGVSCVRLDLCFGGEDGRHLEILFPEEQAKLVFGWEQDLVHLYGRPGSSANS